MIRLVLDASVVLTWCFPDEQSQKAEEVSERIAGGDRIAVPAFWRHEILNALLVGERRKRLTRDLTQAFINDLYRLPVDLDEHPTPATVFDATQSLCRNHALTAYDAAYLEIAMRESCTLATVDTELRRAAIAEGVPVL
ncbi:MAG: type II toxin-antitoxin system VapC family toxin [Acidobacteriia bacterium]|nr:type II toxin-antitoxin system VapC family toxin [Terriglobia bacterium]